MTNGKQWNKRQWQWLAAAAVIALAAAAYMQARGAAAFDWAAFGRSFRDLDARWIGLAVLIAFLTYVGRAMRWAVFLEPLRPKPDLWKLTKATVIGFTAITLFGRPGELVRPYLIARNEAVPVATQLAAWLVERLLDLLFALAIFGYGLSRIGASGAQLGGPLAWALSRGGLMVGILSAICLTLLVLLGAFPDVFGSRLRDSLGFLHAHHAARVEKLIASFLEGVESLRSARAMLKLAVYTALEWILIAACYLCVMRAFPATAGFGALDILIYMGFVAFGTIVQLPGIGGGMQVVSALVLHEIFALPVEMATAVTLALWVTTFITVIPIGLPLALHEGLNWRKIRGLQQEAAL